MALPNSSPTAPAPSAGTPARPKVEEPADQFLNEFRARRVPLVFHLRGGQSITGVVRGFGHYSVDLQTAAGRVLVEKHAIDWVEFAPPPPAPGPLRPAVGQ